MKRVARNHLTLMAGERTPIQTAKWGLVMGLCQIVDGLASILTLGFVLTDLTLSAAFRMSLTEARRKNGDQS